MPQTDSIRLFLCGDVMTGRGIDQVLPHPNDPTLHEPYIGDARSYLKLAERYPSGELHGCRGRRISTVTFGQPSTGKVTTGLKAAHSSTPTESPGASLRSLAIPLPKLLNWAKQKISNMFG